MVMRKKNSNENCQKYHHQMDRFLSNNQFNLNSFDSISMMVNDAHISFI